MTEQGMTEGSYQLTPEAIDVLATLYKRGAEFAPGPIGYMTLVIAWAMVQLGDMNEESSDRVQETAKLVAGYVKDWEARQMAMKAAGIAKEVRH